MVSTWHQSTQYDSPRKNRLIGAILGGKKVAAAARMMDMPWSMASDIWKKYNQTGTTHNRRCPGRPKILDDRTERLVTRKALQARRKTFAAIGNEIEQGASAGELGETMTPGGVVRMWLCCHSHRTSLALIQSLINVTHAF